MTTLEDAINQMLEFGLEVDIPITDGKIHKAKYMGERRKSGWYVLHNLNNLFYGRYGSFKVDEEGRKIKKRVSINIDKDEYEKYKRKAKEKLEIELKKKKELAEKAKLKSLEVWDRCHEYGQSDYLKIKKVNSCGARFFGPTLVIPMVKEGEIRSLQSIKGNGFKKFLKGGDISGCYFIIEGKGKLALVEGFATGASVHMATGWNIAVCFSASNLPKAAPYFRKKDCIICADNDDAGLRYGEIASKELDCDMVYPNGFVDFNDFHVEKGIEELKKCLI